MANTFLLFGLLAATALVAATMLVAAQEVPAGEPIGASVANGSVSLAPEPPAETAVIALPPSMANVAAPPAAAVAPPPAAAAAPPMGLPAGVQAATNGQPDQQQRHQQVAVLQQMLGIPRVIPDDEVLARLSEQLERRQNQQNQQQQQQPADEQQQRKPPKKDEKQSARLFGGFGFGFKG